MMGRRLGGNVVPVRSGEERLKKLEASAAYGGKAIGGKAARSVPPKSKRRQSTVVVPKRIHGLRGSFKL